MPGVNFITSVSKGPQTAPPPDGVSYFTAGLTERGPVGKAVKVRSMAEYEATFGQRQAYSTVYDDLQCFFNEGGAQAYVTRVVGAGATAGSLVLKDQGAAGGASTLTINASSVGPWSTRISVAVVAGTTAGTFTIQIFQDGVLVDQVFNLMSPADAVAKLATNAYINAQSMGSVAVAPLNNPANMAATPLSAGTDNRVAVAAADALAALTKFAPELGAGCVALPTFPSSAVGAGLLAHAQQNNRIALISVAPGSTPAQAKTAAAALIPAGAGGEYGGLFYPSLVVPADGGGTRVIGPEGYVAACRTRAFMGAKGGPWVVPAGDNASARFVSDVDVPLDRPTGDDLDNSQVNAIRVIAGTVRLYGWNCLARAQDLPDYPFLSIRDLLNYVQVKADTAVEAYVWKGVDAAGATLSKMHGTLVGVVQPIADAGGVYPQIDDNTNQQIDPGWVVDTSSALNPTASLAQQQLQGMVGVRPTPNAKIINLTIVKAALQAAL